MGEGEGKRQEVRNGFRTQSGAGSLLSPKVEDVLGREE